MNRAFFAGLLAAASFLPTFQACGSAVDRAETAPLASPADEHKLDAGVLERFARLPLAFEENRGQAPTDTRFVARGPGYQVRLSSNAIALGLVGRGRLGATDQLPIIRMRFIGARTNADATGVDRLESTTNYFRGADAAQQLTDIPNYSRVRFDEVYPGIGLVYYGNQRQLEYDLVLQPGADPNTVRLAFDGANHLRVDENGNLQLAIGAATMQMKRPDVYQEFDGKRHPVAAWFEKTGRNLIGIRTAAYDHKRSLTIDPVLVYSSYLGGLSNDNHGNGIAVDAAGNVYLTGYTLSSSSDFPLLSPYESTFMKAGLKTGQQAFITKVNATGTALVYSTYLGDISASDSAFAIAIDASGSAYVTGVTQGTAFPITTGAYQTTSPGGANNSFVAKLGPAGNTLIYGTYVRNATARGIAVDTSGNAYVTGTTSGAFATTSGAYQTTTSGANAFVLKLNQYGTAALYATFLGGSGSDDGNSIAVDSSGNAYVGGYAGSTNFPVTKAFPSSPQYGGHAFVAKINPQGSGLVYSALLAGEDYEEVFGVAVDANGSAYATGKTASFNFPVTANAFQKSKGGVGTTCFALFGGTKSYTHWPNGFVTKLTPDGSALTYSSFLGGNIAATGSDCSGDWGAAIALDTSGHAFIAGNIESTTGFPLAGDLKAGQPGDTFGFFVAKIGALGDGVLYGTHIGWSVDHHDFGIAVDAKGDAYATSTAQSGDLQPDTFLITTGAYKTTPPTANSKEVIFLKLTTGSSPIATLGTSATNIDNGQTVNATMSVGFASGGGTPTGSIVVYDGPTQLTSVLLSNGTATATLTLPVGIHKLTAVYRNNGAEGVSPTVYVAVNPSPACN